MGVNQPQDKKIPLIRMLFIVRIRPVNVGSSKQNNGNNIASV